MATRNNLRIAYLSGPSEAVNVYSEWSEKRQQNYFGTSYMKQFFDLCMEMNADAYIITTVPGEYSIYRKEGFIIENRPVPSRLYGALYHLAMVNWFVRIIPKLVSFKPHVVITTINQNHWFLLFYLRWFNIPIIPSFHSVLWPKFTPMRRSWRALWLLNQFFILRHVKAALVASKDIARQLRTLIDEKNTEIVEHLPTYPHSQFASIPSPFTVPRLPFTVFFAGRIETNKGVYDVLEIARRLNADRRGTFQFDICGIGSELENLRQRIETLNLQEVVRCHGHLDSKNLSAVLGASHAVIVPTTTAFEEGFNMVCAESILAGRPVVTSAVCPALAYVSDAAVEVQPDNVDQYRQALIQLADDAGFYNQKQAACAALQEQFYDPGNSWAEKLKAVLNSYVVKSTSSRDSG